MIVGTHGGTGGASYSIAFVVLLRDGDDAVGLARLLTDVQLPDAPPALFLAPKVRGMEYFVEPLEPPLRDLPPDTPTVHLLEHQPGLAEVLAGKPGIFYVGLPDPSGATSYRGGEVVTFLSAGPLDFAARIMRDFSEANPYAVLFDPDEARRMEALTEDFPLNLDAPVEPSDDPLLPGITALREKDWKAAEAAFREVLAREPTNGDAHYWLGVTYTWLERWADAAASFRLALANGTRGAPEARRALADAALEAGDIQEAVRAFRAIVDAGEDDVTTHNDLGFALFRAGDYVTARQEFLRAIELNPYNPRHHNNLGATLIRLRDYSAAEGALRTALGLDKDYAAAHSHLAQALQLSDRPEEAADEARRALEIEPNHWRAWTTLGEVLLQLCDEYEDKVLAQEAVESLSSALAAMPRAKISPAPEAEDEARAYLLRAVAWGRAGNVARARQDLRACVDKRTGESATKLMARVNLRRLERRRLDSPPAWAVPALAGFSLLVAGFAGVLLWRAPMNGTGVLGMFGLAVATLLVAALLPQLTSLRAGPLEFVRLPEQGGGEDIGRGLESPLRRNR